MKRILGLDLGTNSIGWAVIKEEQEDNQAKKSIEMSGSRIIPMDAAVLGDFDKGVTQSQTAERTAFRSIRRVRERSLLRRQRLHKVLHKLGFLPEHYEKNIDFDKHPGKFNVNAEPKLAWRKSEFGQPDFLFQNSFQEMLADFAVHQPELLKDGKKVPYDWTIYYLRKKALTERVSKEELAWLLLNFNQKRGYYQLRGEDEEETVNKIKEYHALRVVRVDPTDEKKGKETWYNVHLENGWIYRRTSTVPLNWEGMVKEFIVTTDVNEDGSPKMSKDGTIKRSFSIPKEGDWTLIKKKTEDDLAKNGKTVGAYIYDSLLQNPGQKIRGKLIQTIERNYYKDELRAILTKQVSFHQELQDRCLYEECINILYQQNDDHKRNIAKRDFTYLFIDDILFYQRPLKSKVSLIDNCPYEGNEYVDKETGEIKQAPIKCIAKSHPLFQEFRLWQFIGNIRIYQREKEVDGRLRTDVDVTNEYLKTEDDYIELFKWLREKKDINQKAFLAYQPFGFKKMTDRYRWNYVEDKSYPCNETRSAILKHLANAGVVDPKKWLDEEKKGKEERLWHLLYSVSDKYELEKALRKFAVEYELDEAFVESFKKFPPFQKAYGAYSAKAIKKILPLMRKGEYWNKTSIDSGTIERIEKIIDGECDENIRTRVREKCIHLSCVDDFKGLPLWLACYVIYGRHSESKEIVKWEKPEDIDVYLKSFRQHSMRNPIVEQVVLETLRTVRDIWKKAGQIDEIHVELGREMKKTNKEREKDAKQILKNENTNLRIKALLTEFMNPEFEIEGDIRPYSPAQQEILRIYEDGVLNSAEELPEPIVDFLKKIDARKQPTRSEFLRYRLWLEQKYRSPYTGEMIPLSSLFTPAYEIEHIIPQSRYFDDSFSNKVICESAVNKLKDNRLGYEFIEKCYGSIVEVGLGKKAVKIYSVDEYEEFVKKHYSKSRTKMKKLLMNDIPDKFVERQLNDSRYISNEIKRLLSNVVREKDEKIGEYEQEETSKHVIVCTGAVTDRLKKDWGMNDVWNNIVYPRFERLNALTDSEQFGKWESKDGKRVFQTGMPLDLQKGFSKKRIDHRHHAMDAIVIACATREHVNYLNNESAQKGAKISRRDLQQMLCEKKKSTEKGGYKWVVKKPWTSFTQDSQSVLSNIIVSFKSNLRVINKTSNTYQSFDETDEKVLKKQIGGERWAIRKPLHKDTVFGRVNLRKVKNVRLAVALDASMMIVDKKVRRKVQELFSYKYDKKGIEKYFKANAFLWKELNPAKVAVYYFTDDTSEPLVAVRKVLDDSFNEKKIEGAVTDTGIRKILLRHLAENGNKPELAFSPDGISEMNKDLLALNGGKNHQPIYKVRVYEPRGNKFNVGDIGNKRSKFVEAAKGTNLFFGVYQTSDGERVYETIPLNIVIERKKMGWGAVPEENKNGDKLLFFLSPNHLVYVPTIEELENGINVGKIDGNRIYKFVSCTGNEGHFVPANIANPIVPVLELGSNNKAQRAWTGEMIKEICLPIQVDRIGNIISKGKNND